MGARERMKQKKLAAKLKAIREALGLSQSEIVDKLELEGLGRTNISGYEVGRIEPPISVLIAYANAANICLDVLLDDRYDLPAQVPSKKTFHPHK
jgi:transcriptional regulator with XRE-family HTH domain